jgi:hypothetical protein
MFRGGKMKLRKLSINRIHRLYDEIKEIGRKIEPKLNEKDKRLYNQKMKRLKKLYKKSMVFYVIRAIAGILLYISVVSVLFGNVFLLEWFTDALIVIAGILGTTILAVLLYISQLLINLYISDAHLVSDYIVALDIKYS